MSDYSFLKKYYFIIEADEFNRHFLHLNIDHLLITNIQRDHPDTYPHPQDYDQAFAQCIDHTRFTVTMLASQSDLAIAQKYADRIHFCPHRVYRFENIFGQHNHDNASLVE